MKIRIRDVGLLAAGFITAAIVTIWFASTPTRVPTAAVPRVVVTGPVLAVASVPPQFLVAANIQVQLPPMRDVTLDGFDSQSPLSPPMRRSVDLIDTRYQPDIKLEDSK